MSFGQWASDCRGVPLDERFNFNPLMYFLYSGIDGAWFEPEDMSTMFQDSAGTTPVTALERPVGLWLDKSQGLKLGPELVTNGTFDSDGSGWSQVSTDTAMASVAGEGYLVSTVGYARNYQQITTVVGKWYSIIADARIGTSSGIMIYAGTVLNGNQYGSVTVTSTTNKKVRLIFLATTTTTYIATRLNTSGDSLTGFIDNISVRELKGNHATQSIPTSCPTLSARYNLLLNSATLSTQSVTTVAAPYTLSFTGTGSVTLSGSATGTLVGTGANNRVSLAFTPTAGTLTLTVTGSVTLAMLAFGTLTTYQAITTATSYDSVGWSRYVRFDGIDDYLNLPYMGLYANGSASVILPMSSSRVAGVYSRIIAETSALNSQPCYILPREDLNTTGTDIQITTDSAAVILSTSVVPFTNEQINIRSYVDSGSNVKTFADSSIKQSVDYTRSGVLTLNSTLIGAQATPTGVDAFAAIKLYGLIITKSALSDTDRRCCEKFLASRLSTLGVTLS